MTADELARREAAVEAARAAHDLPRARALAVQYVVAAGPRDEAADPARGGWFRSRYVAGQVELAAGYPARAADLLTPLLPLADALPDELAARVRGLAAEAFARTGRLAAAADLVALVPPAMLIAHPVLRLRVVRVRLILGEVQTLAAELAGCDAALADDRANRAVLACDEGRAWDAAHDLDRAVSCWERADVFTRPLGPHPARADALVQLGRIDHLRTRLGSAADRYDEADDSAAGGPFAPEVGWRRVLLWLDLDDPVRAKREADRLLKVYPLADLPDEVRPVAAVACAAVFGGWDGAPAEVRAYLAARAGDAATAARLYGEALADAPAADRRARLAFALGSVAADLGRHGEAADWLRRAEELARDRRLPGVLARSLEARGQLAADQAGDEETARGLFEEAARVGEAEASSFRSGLDRAAHRWRRASVLRRLVRSAARRADPAAVFHYQELERGRFLLDLLDAADRRAAGGAASAELAAVDRELAGCESRLAGGTSADQDADLRRREGLLLDRDRLFEAYLRDRSRPGDGLVPAVPTLADLRRALPPGAAYLAPTLAGEDLILLAVPPDGRPRVVVRPGAAAVVADQAAEWQGLVAGQTARYRAGLLNDRDRRELDDLLDRAGAGPLGSAVAEGLGGATPGRVVWAPDGPLHGFPVQAVRQAGRYLVERVAVVWSFGGAMVVRQARDRWRLRGWWRPAVVVAEGAAELPGAAAEAAEVAAGFWRCRVIGPGADRAAVSAWLRRAKAAHFATHAEFDPADPFRAAVVLPSGDRVTALDWLAEPVRGLRLVALAGCRSAGVGSGPGGEPFGLVAGLLGAGVRAVLAGLWPLPDRETRGVVGGFYRHRRAADLATALARAQREALGGSPLGWAGLAVYGDADALPAGWFGRRRRRA